MNRMQNRFTLAKSFLAVALACGPTTHFAFANGDGGISMPSMRPRTVTASTPIGTVESWGAVTINGQQVGRQSLIWSGDLLQAPAATGVQAALNGVGQVSVRPGAVVRLATNAASQGPRTLTASLISGELAVRLQPGVNARLEVNGEAFVASRGANFRAILRSDGLSVEADAGEVLPVGSWATAVPKNFVRDAAAMVAEQAAGQQAAARRYLIKPYNLGSTTDVRARSTRSVQVRVTDENDRPVPDAPVLFFFGNGGPGGAATPLRVTTNSNGIASADYTAPNAPGDRIQIRAQVEGTDAVWQGALQIVAAKAGFWAPQNAIPIFTVVGVGLGVGIYKIATKEAPPTTPPITQRPGGTVIVP